MSAAPVWHKIKPGSYTTADGWNAWRRTDRLWNLRDPLGRYYLGRTFAEVRAMREGDAR